MVNVMEPKLELLGSYGLSEDFKYQEKGTGLRKLKDIEEPFDFDLLDGYHGNNDNSHRIYDNRDKLGNILIWMMKNRELLTDPNCNDKPFDVDIVCGNGVFLDILTAPFDEEERQIVVQRFKGLLFFRRANELRVTGHEMYSYAGNKFQELMTQKVNPDDAGQTYYNVIRAKLGNHTIVHSYQADGINLNVVGEPKIDDFVELKTSGEIRDKFSTTFQFWNGFKTRKSKNWWSQMVMTGIKNFVVGIKYKPEADSIHCDLIERLTIDDIKKCASGWSPVVAMDTLNKFLNYVKMIVKEDNPNVAHLFKINKCEFTKSRHGSIVVTGTEFSHDTLELSDNQHNQYSLISKSMIELLESMDPDNDAAEDIHGDHGHRVQPVISAG